MRNLSPWPMLAMLLLGILFLREPRFQRKDEIFLRWLLENSQTPGATVPLTVIEIGNNPLAQKPAGEKESTEASCTLEEARFRRSNTRSSCNPCSNFNRRWLRLKIF